MNEDPLEDDRDYEDCPEDEQDGPEGTYVEYSARNLPDLYFLEV